MVFVGFQKLFCSLVFGGDDLDFDNVVNEFHTAVFPCALIRSVEGANGKSAESGNKFFTYLFELLRFDFFAVVISERQVNLIFLQAAREVLGRGTAEGLSFLKGIFLLLRILRCSSRTPYTLLVKHVTGVPVFASARNAFASAFSGI